MTNNSDNEKMESTMQEISQRDDEIARSKRSSLQKEISRLKEDLKIAEQNQAKPTHNDPAYLQISPELANEHHKKIVFLRKDLAARIFEYEQLDVEA